MLETIEINNFKVQEKFKIDSLSRINLICGQNNVGKTSLLEAIFLFYERNIERMLTSHYPNRGKTEIMPAPEYLWAPLFTNFDMDKTISIQVNNSEKLSISIGTAQDFSEILKEDSNLPLLLDTYQSSNVLKNKAIVRIIKNTETIFEALQIILNNKVYSKPTILPKQNSKNVTYYNIRHANLQADASRLGKLDKDNKLVQVIEIMKIIEPNLTDLSVVPEFEKTYIYCDVGFDQKIPVILLGDGVNRILKILLFIASSSENDIVLIDEVENGLHWSVQPKLWKVIFKLAEELNIQVFATTHSRDCVKGFNEIWAENIEKASFYRLDNYKSEHIKAVQYDQDTLRAALTRGIEFR